MGAVAGVCLALALQSMPVIATGVAVGLLLAVTLVGEVWSLTAVIDRTPGLRHLDRLGRKTTHG